MATSYLSPGVYIEEVDRGSKPIEAVGTSTCAFIGESSVGPTNEAVLTIVPLAALQKLAVDVPADPSSLEE